MDNKQKADILEFKVEFISLIAPAYQAAFEEWIKDFPVDIIKFAFDNIRKEAKYKYNEFNDTCYDDFKYDVMFACFCASNYSKEKDAYISRYNKDIDCLNSIKSQKNAINKIKKFLNGKASILSELDSELNCKLNYSGISYDKSTYDFRFRLFNDAIECYEKSLDDLKLTNKFSIGCLKYYGANHPKQTPEIESMLIIHLAVYFNGLANNQTPWVSFRRRFEVDIPTKFKLLRLNTKQAIADLVGYSTQKNTITSDSITDVLNKRIKPRMKLCPWSVSYHS